MTLAPSDIAERLQQLDEYQFEALVAELWEQRGWNTEETGQGSDRGIDVIATRENPYPEKQLIQAKRYHPTNRVGSRDIREYNSLKDQEANVDQVIIVTTSGFTDDALLVADDLNVKCIDGATIAELISQHGGFDLINQQTTAAENKSNDIFDTIKTRRDESTTPKSEPQHQTSVVDDGDELTAEITGLTRVETTFSGSGVLTSDYYFNGILATFTLYGRSGEPHRELAIEDPSEISFFDDQDTEYHPVGLGAYDLPAGWVALGGRSRFWIDVPGTGSVNFITGVELPGHAKVTKITIDRYDIAIDLDHELRLQLDQLPNDIQNIS